MALLQIIQVQQVPRAAHRRLERCHRLTHELIVGAGSVRRERARHDERLLAPVLTDRVRALRTEAEKVPPAIVAKLGIDVVEIKRLHRQLTRVIAAAHPAE